MSWGISAKDVKGQPNQHLQLEEKVHLMKTRFTALCHALALTLVICSLSAFVVAQSGSESVTPRFVVIPPKPAAPGSPLPASTLQTWNGSFTNNGTNFPFVMVGQDPSSGQGTIITTYIIPVKIILSTGETFDPLGSGPLGPIGRTITSPIFDQTTNYTQGGTNLGNTQFVDAFQRGNFWSIVQNHPNYHVLLGGPTASVSILPELTLNVPAGSGHIGSPFGHQVAEVGINYFDNQISAYMTQHSQQITPATFPMFETTNTYLTQGGCCIGGYHSANGQQSYGHFTYITFPGDFSQDVSALSHEVSEWMDDPLTNGGNGTPCGILEVGDPLETTANFGDFPFQLHGFTYHMQDEVFLRYFGADPNTSVNSWWSFENFQFTRICQNGS
jgi:hypothetical protein